MAGIYIHIPFCTKACNYCDFHFSTSLKHKSEIVFCLLKEIEERKDYLQNELIETVYFGGGTPSLLSESELSSIINEINTTFNVNKHPEITLEANPDDLTLTKLKELKQTGINRLSIGIQSFYDKTLQWMNRSHNYNQAINAVNYAQDIGISNISIDLIYGIPNMTMQEWEDNIDKAIALNVPHISAYCLTVEEKTVLHHQVVKGLAMPKDDVSIKQFKLLIKKLEEVGYEHYEISNFAKKDYVSKHNSAYWLEKKYLGIGPSAHSYNEKSRTWNVANNMKYMNAIKNGTSYNEQEIIDTTTAYNEYILTRLRTIWGIDELYIKNRFGEHIYQYFTHEISTYIINRTVKKEKSVYTLSLEGKLIADQIAGDLFFV